MAYPIKQLEGRDHFVVPVVMIVEGVLHGSNGPIFYPSQVLSESVPLWNGKPVVVYHPSMQDGGVAGNPEVFNKQKIGTIFDAAISQNRLIANAWIDAERVRWIDPRVYDTIQSGTKMEVSTGVFCYYDEEADPNTFKGKPFDRVASGILPDHLAILPDLIGACSIADGAGLCRNDNGFGYVWPAQNQGHAGNAAPGVEEPLLIPEWVF